MSRISQNKTEKQAIDAKVAKVRELVHKVSNNDIVLALHNYDMDVGRTIDAFVDGGVHAALGAWEKTGTVTNKKKKGGAASAVHVTENSSTTTSTTTETPKVSSVSTNAHPSANGARQQQRKQPQSSTMATANAHPTPTAKQNATAATGVVKDAHNNHHHRDFAQLTEDTRRHELERLVREHDAKTFEARKQIDVACRQKSDAFAAIASALTARERQLDAYFEKARRELDINVSGGSQRSRTSSTTGSADELARLATECASLDTIVHQSNIIHTDKVVKAIEKLGAGFLPPSAANMNELSTLSNGSVASAKSPLSSAGVSNGNFGASPRNQQQNGKSQTTTAVLNGKSMTESEDKPADIDNIKYPVPQVSLASSIGDDSGNQVSPIYQQEQQHSAINKPTLVVDSGLLQSDGLSGEELAALQQQITAKFAAQGINLDAIIGTGSGGESGAAPRRRNPPQSARRNDEHQKTKMTAAANNGGNGSGGSFNKSQKTTTTNKNAR